MLLQPSHPGHVALRPAGWEVLDRALLIGEEKEYVHTRHLADWGCATGLWACGSCSGSTSAEQDSGGDSGSCLQ